MQLTGQFYDVQLEPSLNIFQPYRSPLCVEVSSCNYLLRGVTAVVLFAGTAAHATYRFPSSSSTEEIERNGLIEVTAVLAAGILSSSALLMPLSFRTYYNKGTKITLRILGTAFSLAFGAAMAGGCELSNPVAALSKALATGVIIGQAFAFSPEYIRLMQRVCSPCRDSYEPDLRIP